MSANSAHDVFGGTPAFAEPMETHSAFGESSFDPEPLWGGGDDTPPHRDFEIQRALEGTDTTAGDVPPVVLDVLGSGGQALEGPIQRALEDRMDADFSSVRVHTGSQAVQAAEAIDAKVFTCGNDVVFNSGEYDPESPEGQYLLAHELAHVRQQTGAAISMMPQKGADLEIDPDPRLEREADETAREVLVGDEPLVVNRLGAEVHIQRLANWAEHPEITEEDDGTDDTDRRIDLWNVLKAAGAAGSLTAVSQVLVQAGLLESGMQDPQTAGATVGLSAAAFGLLQGYKHLYKEVDPQALRRVFAAAGKEALLDQILEYLGADVETGEDTDPTGVRK